MILNQSSGRGHEYHLGDEVIEKREALWAVRIEQRGTVKPSFMGACDSGHAFWMARLFRTRSATRQWIREQGEYYRSAYKPRPARVIVTVAEFEL